MFACKTYVPFCIIPVIMTIFILFTTVHVIIAYDTYLELSSFAEALVVSLEKTLLEEDWWGSLVVSKGLVWTESSYFANLCTYKPWHNHEHKTVVHSVKTS